MVLQVSLRQTADRMVTTLAEHAARHDPPVDLRGVTAKNFNVELDRRFGDGGQARCELFADLCWEYCNQFGKFRDDMTGPWHDAHDRALRTALKLLEKRFPAKKEV